LSIALKNLFFVLLLEEIIMSKRQLNAMIQKLRGGAFCLYEVLESGLVSETILGVLVCDYVSHLQTRLTRAGKGMHIKGLTALEAKRSWLVGRASNVELGRTRAIVQQQMATDPRDEALFFAWAATFASSEKAFCAVLEGLRRRKGELPISFEEEVVWMGRRLALYLEDQMLQEQKSRSWIPMPPAPGLPVFTLRTA
jgi:hypothetical protein